jgi:hypothetical protein
MLWHKAWLETRARFLAGLCLLTLLAAGTVFGYPMVANRLASLPNIPLGAEDALGRAIRESVELSRTFRGYAYMNAFSQNLSQLGTLFAVLLGIGALRVDAPGTLFTLSLPVSRRQILVSRALSGLSELLVIVLVPSLAIALLAPAIGQSFGLRAALVHALCLFAGTSMFFGLTFWLSTIFTDNWRPGLTACALAVGFALAETALGDDLPFGPYQLIRGDRYFYDAQVPWLSIAAAAAASAASIYAALVSVDQRDF